MKIFYEGFLGVYSESEHHNKQWLSRFSQCIMILVKRNCDLKAYAHCNFIVFCNNNFSQDYFGIILYLMLETVDGHLLAK